MKKTTLDNLDIDNFSDAAILTEKQRVVAARKAASLEKTNQQDIWRRIVVKVISWSDGLLSGGIIKQTDKITREEWKVYSDRCFKINIGQDKKKIEKDLDITKKKIEFHNGFAN